MLSGKEIIEVKSGLLDVDPNRLGRGEMMVEVGVVKEVAMMNVFFFILIFRFFSVDHF